MKREDAIKELRGFLGQLTEGCQEAIKVLIPELAESEDERIRKDLIKYLESDRDCQPCQDVSFYDSSIAWLEKQKGLKPDVHSNAEIETIRVFRPLLGTSIEKAAKDVIRYREEVGGNLLLGFNGVYILVHNTITAESIVNSYFNFIADKSAEWSEEDEEALDMCLDAIPKRWTTKSGTLLTKWLKDNIRLKQSGTIFVD